MSEGYGTMPAGPRRWLSVKEPNSFLDYTENVQKVITNPHTNVVDPLVSLALTARPSGTGELALSRLGVDSTGFLITWWEDAGVPGRTYTINLEGVTVAGRRFQWVWGQECDRVFATYPLPPAPNPGFGTPVTWSAVSTPVPALFFTVPENSGLYFFGGQPTGAFVPLPHPPPVIIPSLDLRAAANAGVYLWGGQPTGAFVPLGVPPSVPVPSLNFTVPANSGVLFFGGQPTGNFVSL